jgi:hypothetical protein
MIKRISRIAPLQLGIVLAVLYGALAVIFVPFILLGTALSAHNNGAFHGLGAAFAILIPIIYAILGFVGGVISAAIYNLIARFTGGIEMTLSDVPADASF